MLDYLVNSLPGAYAFMVASWDSGFYGYDSRTFIPQMSDYWAGSVIERIEKRR